MESGTEGFLEDVWGSSATDIFIVGSEDGSGSILHYDGISWSSVSNDSMSSLQGIWGASHSDVFAVGLDGVVLHYDGAQWTNMPTGTNAYLYDVWGSSANNVFAVGKEDRAGVILHYEGGSWTKMEIPSTGSFQGIWGASAADVFAVTIDGDIWHYDSVTWQNRVNCSRYAYDIWGSSPTNLFVVGASYSDNAYSVWRYDGVTCERMPMKSQWKLESIWGSSEADIFAVGENGMILHFQDPADGGLWGQCSDLGGGWRWSNWFGYLYDAGGGWIYHQEHGWMYAAGSSTEDIWFYDPTFQWFWSSADAYPYLYRADDNCWLWYLEASSNPRRFYNFCTNQWE
jgi:hypothetical protein